MKFDEVKKIKSACVYKLNFPDGKSYIGQTKNLRDRIDLYSNVLLFKKDRSKVESAIAEYGLDSIDYEVLASPCGLEGEDLLLALSILEIKYIRHFGTLCPNGYNASIGGELLGIPSDFISTSVGISNYSGSKPVLCYDIDGNFVMEFESIEKCAYGLGVDSSTLSPHIDKGTLFRNEYMLRFKRYGKVPEKILPFKKKVIDKVIVNKIYEDKVILRERVKAAPRDQVLKYNADGEYCGTYDSTIDAAVSIGLKHLNKGVLTRGFIFFDYDGGEIKQNIGRIERAGKRTPKYSDFIKSSCSEKIEVPENKGWSKLINDFKVAKYDLSGNLVDVYDSIKHASYMNGIAYSGIWACVFGKTKKSKGYIWRKYK